MTGTEERRIARERALSLLYEAEMKGERPADVLAALPVEPDPFALELVSGVEAHQERIDELIAEAARGWTLARMAAIDRITLRIGTYELLERPEIPVAVVLNEAVELVKRFSTDDSGRFVNGVLAALAAKLRPGT